MFKLFKKKKVLGTIGTLKSLKYYRRCLFNQPHPKGSKTETGFTLERIYEKECKEMEKPEVGATYQHFKGGVYKVIALARDTETSEEVVVYESGVGDSPCVWVRKLTDWNSSPDQFPGTSRFKKLS